MSCFKFVPLLYSMSSRLTFPETLWAMLPSKLIVVSSGLLHLEFEPFKLIVWVSLFCTFLLSWVVQKISFTLIYAFSCWSAPVPPELAQLWLFCKTYMMTNIVKMVVKVRHVFIVNLNHKSKSYSLHNDFIFWFNFELHIHRNPNKMTKSSIKSWLICSSISAYWGTNTPINREKYLCSTILL